MGLFHGKGLGIGCLFHYTDSVYSYWLPREARGKNMKSRHARAAPHSPLYPPVVVLERVWRPDNTFETAVIQCGKKDVCHTLRLHTREVLGHASFHAGRLQRGVQSCTWQRLDMAGNLAGDYRSYKLMKET